MAGIGIDMVEINRFDKHHKNPESRFCKLVFTQSEMKYLSQKSQASMAGLYAAKEAAAKALGTGFREFWPRDIEIQHDNKGAPRAVLHGKAKQAAQGKEILISITHTKKTAAAMAQLVAGR